VSTAPARAGGRTVGVGYVAAVTGVAVVLLVAVQTGAIPPAWAALVVVPLGPIGLLLGMLLLVGGAGFAVEASQSSGLVLVVDAAVLALVVAIASVNALVAASIARSWASRPVPERYRGRIGVAWDRLLGGSAFLVAGALFVAVCFVAGFVVLTAGGVDVPVPEGQAAPIRAAAAIAWCLAAIAAVAGVVLWVRAGARGTAILRWGATDLAVQVAALAAVLLAASRQ
jgi:hypothetical protein